MKKKISKRIGYLCGVDYQHELGEVMDSTPIYSSIEDLKRQRTCWENCGILKVEVKALEWVEPQDFNNLGKNKEKK